MEKCRVVLATDSLNTHAMAPLSKPFSPEEARGLAEWKLARSEARSTVDWQFTTADARIKLKHLYPKCSA